MLIRGSILAAAVALAALCGSQAASAEGVFTLSSPSFKDGERLPAEERRQQQGQSELRRRECFAGAELGEPARRHQELCAADVRSGRPSARRRQPLGGLWHSGSRHRLCRGRSIEAEREICRRHRAPIKLSNYFGPCTPPGAPHHYTFTLIATDLEPTALQAGLTRDELIKALDGHAKAATGLVGTFSKP